MTWKYWMMVSRAVVSRRARWCGNTDSLLYRGREQSLKVKARKRELYRAYTSLRLLEPIKLWIKEASRDGLHDYHPVSVLSQQSSTLILPLPTPLDRWERSRGHAARNLPTSAFQQLSSAFLSNHLQLTDVNGMARWTLSEFASLQIAILSNAWNSSGIRLLKNSDGR